MGYTCHHSCCCCAPRVAWTIPVASCQVYYYTVPAWPVYTPCTIRWGCVGCSCRCACCPCASPKASAAAAPVAPAVKEIMRSSHEGEPRKLASGKIEVQGKVELTSSEEMRHKKTRSRSVDKGVSPREWRRVGSLPKMRAEKAPAAGGSSPETTGHRKSSSSPSEESSEEDRRCEGTFVIKGIPLCRGRGTRRHRESKGGESGRERVVKGTIIFKAS
ncbi:hypothetical protein Emag_006428 [Eimeria magna]